jgi:hypothetical protein
MHSDILLNCDPAAVNMRVIVFCSIFAVFLTGFASAADGYPELPASCPQILPAPAAMSLPNYFLPKPIKDSQLDDIETIRQTLHFYALVLDSKAFFLLDRVFIPKATANYSGLAGIFEGLPAIQTFLAGSLADYPKTQHLIGNHIIDVCASKNAVSQTYFQATHFPNTTAGIFTAYVRHQDVWEKTKEGWRIVDSNFGITVSAFTHKDITLRQCAHTDSGKTMSGCVNRRSAF